MGIGPRQAPAPGRHNISINSADNPTRTAVVPCAPTTGEQCLLGPRGAHPQGGDGAKDSEKGNKPLKGDALIGKNVVRLAGAGAG